MKMATTVYKRYLIQINPMTGAVSIAKNGAHIGYAGSVEEARSLIDSLVD
jgi:hypothetical protein